MTLYEFLKLLFGAVIEGTCIADVKRPDSRGGLNRAPIAPSITTASSFYGLRDFTQDCHSAETFM
jgi:hypothetical protein